MMERRKFLKIGAVASLASFLPVINYELQLKRENFSSRFVVYSTWGAHDQLSDKVPLTEQLVNRLKDKLVEVKQAGVQIDAFLLDYGWFDRKSSLMSFDRFNWPNGPDQWIESCIENNLLPGLWFPVNQLDAFMDLGSKWQNSRGVNGSFSFVSGSFLNDYLSILIYWYKKGIRLFKFDFADFNCISQDSIFEPQEEVERNERNFLNLLRAFKKSCPDVVLMGYNGFFLQERTAQQNVDVIKEDWLEVLDTVYSGDPKASNVPCSNFWRSVDLYTDQMIQSFIVSGVDYRKIDCCSLMLGNAGTIYRRGKQNWKETYLLSLARGGSLQTIYGDICLLNQNDLCWMASVQKIFFSFLNSQSIKFMQLGNPIKGNGLYGYHLSNDREEILLLVNPTQSYLSFDVEERRKLNVLYAYNEVSFSNKKIELYPEQLIVLVSKEYMSEAFYPGEQTKIHKRYSEVEKKELLFCQKRRIVLKKDNLEKGWYKCLIELKDNADRSVFIKNKSSNIQMNFIELFDISCKVNHKLLHYTTELNRPIWSGTSWMVFEFECNEEGVLEIEIQNNSDMPVTKALLTLNKVLQ